MKKALLGFLLSLGSAMAISITPQPLRGVLLLHFDEPVVPLSQVEASFHKDAGPRERGVDTIIVTGDEAHNPELRWVDQDALQVNFPEGTSTQTAYTLSFSPGTTYLSGKPLAEEQISLHMPQDVMNLRQLPGFAQPTFLLHAARFRSAESVQLSPEVPLTCTFCPKDGEKPTICGIRRLARLRDLPENTVRQLISETDRDWAQLTEDSAIPGLLLVTPEQELPKGEPYTLRITAADSSPLAERSVEPNGLETLLLQRYEAPKEGAEPTAVLHLLFSLPIDSRRAKALFESLRICKGEAQATLQEDGSLLLQADGRSTRFTLLAPTKKQPSNGPILRHHGAEDGEQPGYRYEVPNQQGELRIAVSGELPEGDLDIIVPAGTQAALGLATDRDHTHRIRITPTAVTVAGHKVQLFQPGATSFTLRTTCHQALRAQVYRFSPKDWARSAPLREAFLRSEEESSLPLGIIAERLKQHLCTPQESAEWARQQDALVKQAEKRAKLEQRFLAYLKRAEAGPELTLPAPAVPEGSLCNSGELTADMKALGGGALRPGGYILVLEAAGHKEYVQVEVTGIGASDNGRKTLVWNMADGKPVDAAEIRPYHGDETDAVAPSRDSGIVGLLVQKGEDYRWVERTQQSFGERGGDRLLMKTDRPLYHPGEKVRVMGLLRRTTKEGEVGLIPELQTVQMTVRRPNGEKLAADTVPLTNGGFTYDFTLPEGEEDITGRYSVLCEFGEDCQAVEAECQIFRRNAMEDQAEIELTNPAPNGGIIRVKARELNGAALGKSRAELRLSASGVPLRVEEADLSAQRVFSLPLNEEGVAELPFTVDASEPYDHGRLTAEVDVINDREEHCRAEATATLYAADFTAELSDGGALRLPAQVGTKEHDQSVRVTVSGDVQDVEDLPNGFQRVTQRERVFFEGEVTVPAGGKAHLSLPEDTSMHPLRVTVEGTDPAGHRMAAKLHLYRPARHRVTREGPKVEIALTGDPSQQPLGLRTVLRNREEARGFLVYDFPKHFLALSHIFAAGEETVERRLSAEDAGTCTLLAVGLQRDAQGLYSEVAFCEKASLFIPPVQHRMGVALELPNAPVRPGSKVSIGGRVCGPDGRPTASRVLLWAVDEGTPGLDAAEPFDPFVTFYSPAPYVNDFAADREDEPHRAMTLHPEPALWMGQDVAAPHLMHGLTELFRGEPYILDEMAVGAADGVPANDLRTSKRMEAPEAAPAPVMACVAGSEEPRLRTDFSPMALWLGWVPADAEGHFAAEVTLPDTLTRYRIFAVAAAENGSDFGSATAELTVNQPVMLTPGTPLFMSAGDCLQLPLSITNNTDKEGTWQVQLEGGEPQSIRLAAHRTGTLLFTVRAAQEGALFLRWTARGEGGSDAVEGRFPVRYPAPVLREAHHLVLRAGEEVLSAARPAPELAASPRTETRLSLSANPLLHLSGAADYVLGYPYGCTEQTASGLLPWLLYDRLAPFCPKMAETAPAQVRETVNKAVKRLAERQQADGGLSYWADAPRSCFWASAYVGMVLAMAAEEGYELPEGLLPKLREYLKAHRSELEAEPAFACGARYALGRCLGDRELMLSALKEPQEGSNNELALLRALLLDPEHKHEAFLKAMRSIGHDYRHRSTWNSGWQLLALYEYAHSTPPDAPPATMQLPDGSTATLGNGAVSFTLKGAPDQQKAAYKVLSGEVYATVAYRSVPEQTDYPGVTEKGLQVTRRYEKKGSDGIWREAADFAEGDLVRVTLTCAKVDPELHYFVLEDYLPSSMEALNPAIESQSAGTDPLPFCADLDHKEYLSDRVRGFCTRWCGRHLLNMSYYARVKRAGTATAPPAEAQLMYEPQTYGLSPSRRVTTKP